MTYCIEVWGCLCFSTPTELYIFAAKKIVRIMNFSYYLAHTKPLFLSMEFLTLRKYVFIELDW